jgi:hypothetical protein
MIELFQLILGVLASLFKSRARLQAEILILRQQVNVLRRQAPKRPHLNNTDRCLLVWLYHWFPSLLGAIAIGRPETIIRWLDASAAPLGSVEGLQDWGGQGFGAGGTIRKTVSSATTSLPRPDLVEQFAKLGLDGGILQADMPPPTNFVFQPDLVCRQHNADVFGRTRRDVGEIRIARLDAGRTLTWRRRRLGQVWQAGATACHCWSRQSVRREPLATR